MFSTFTAFQSYFRENSDFQEHLLESHRKFKNVENFSKFIQKSKIF